MKNITLTLGLAMLCYMVNAQVLFEQNFNNGSIAPMTSVDNDGYTNHSRVTDIGKSWSVQKGLAHSTSWFDPPNKADNWLITPAISITEKNTFLRWYGSSQDGAHPEDYKVLISTTTNSLDQFNQELLSVEQEGESERHSLSLDDFIGETIYIAFVLITQDGYILRIDDIVVEVSEVSFVEAVTMTATSYPFYRTNNIPIKIKLDIVNNTGVDIAETQLCTSNNGQYNIIEPVSNLAKERSLDIDIMGSNSTDIQEIELCLLSSDGQILGTTKTSVQILDNPPKKKLLLEETSGTWCGWCPAGVVLLEDMNKLHEDDYVGVSIHIGDPMELASVHENGSYQIAGLAVPNVSLDRYYHNLHPLETEEEFLNLRTALASPFDLKLNTRYNEENRTVQIDVYTSSIIDLDNSTDRFSLSILLTEDNVRGETEDYAQVNYFSEGRDLYNTEGTINWRDLPDPVPAGDMVYEKVLRAMLTKFEGADNSIPSSIKKGQEYLYSIKYKIAPEFDPRSSNIVVVVQDTYSKAAINAEVSPVISANTTATHEIAQNILQIYPNPVQEQLVVTQSEPLQLQYKLYTVDGKILDTGLFHDKQHLLNTSDLMKGIYFLEVWDIATSQRVIEKIEKL